MAKKIDPEKAKSLVQEFQDQNQAAGEHAWKTPEGYPLNGFYIDRESLEEILKNDKVSGIHINFAKHPDFVGKSDKVHTITFSGSETPQPGATQASATSRAVYSDTPTCPPFCPPS